MHANEHQTNDTHGRGRRTLRSALTTLLAALAIVGCAEPIEEVDDTVVDRDVAIERMQETAAFLAPASELADDETLVPKAGCNAQYCSRSFNHSSARNTEFAVNRYTCVLSRAYGNYGDSGEAKVFEGSTHWRAEGKGSMICVPYSKYTVASDGWVGSSSAFQVGRSSDGHSSRSTWWGDAITFVTGVAGEMEGRDDQVYIQQSTSATSASKLHVDWNSDPHGTFWGWGTSIFAGSPGAQRARLWGYDPDGHWAVGDTRASGTFEFSVSVPGSGYSSYIMSPTSTALCGFTRIAGDFDDNNEYVEIKEYTGYNPTRWRLRAKESGASSAAAKARCHLYDQRVHLIPPG